MAIVEQDIGPELQDQVAKAMSEAQPLRIVGGDSKAFYGHQVEATELELGAHSGVIDYDPAELVITLRAGCRLTEVEALLAEHGQMLGFEPPRLGDQATIGGCVASGLAGPRRAYAGGVREFILGVKLLNGRAEIVSFGGRVIKNVAGFDVSRLMVGAHGTLGAILELSLRVIPHYEAEMTLSFEHANADQHILWVNQLGSKPLPLSASSWYQGRSFLRLSGSETGLNSAQRKLGGEPVADPWAGLRDQSHEFFQTDQAIKRVALPATSDDIAEGENQLIEWGGAQRWLRAEGDLDALREKVAGMNGTVCAYRNAAASEAIFHPLAEPMLALHRRLKSSFDPAGIFNPGRLYPNL